MLSNDVRAAEDRRECGGAGCAAAAAAGARLPMLAIFVKMAAM
jgi:hypothetical protein